MQNVAMGDTSCGVDMATEDELDEYISRVIDNLCHHRHILVLGNVTQGYRRLLCQHPLLEMVGDGQFRRDMDYLLGMAKRILSRILEGCHSLVGAVLIRAIKLSHS